MATAEIATQTPEVDFQVAGAVGVITLTLPPLNLLTFETFYRLFDKLDEAEESGIRALIIRSGADHFSCGVNVEVFKDVPPEEAARVFTQALSQLARFENLPFPTIAVVHGVCAAAGLELALGCDLIWAAESTQFLQVEARVGAGTFLGGAQRLAERAGSARAREIVFTGDSYPASVFEQWNIINRVVPDEDLWDDALAFAERLAAGPTKAHAATKRLVQSWLDHGMQAADRQIVDVASQLFGTADMQRNVKLLLDEGTGALIQSARFDGR